MTDNIQAKKSGDLVMNILWGGVIFVSILVLNEILFPNFSVPELDTQLLLLMFLMVISFKLPGLIRKKIANRSHER